MVVDNGMYGYKDLLNANLSFSDIAIAFMCQLVGVDYMNHIFLFSPVYGYVLIRLES